jgi:hypothetical protein
MALTKANSTVIDTTDTGNAIKTNSAVGLAPLDSPTFIGSPSAPTQANSDNTTRLATTAYVTTKTNFLAPLANPYFTGQVFLPEGTSSVPGLVFQNDGAPDTGLYHMSDGVFGVTCNTVPVAQFQSSGMSLLGTPTAPTAAAGNNSTQIATTAFVMSNASSGSLIKYTEMTASGTFTKQANTNYMEIILLGGGSGGGCGGGGYNNIGGNGGRAAAPFKYLITSPANTYTVAIGAGSAGGAHSTASQVGYNSNDGGNTTFGSYTGYGAIGAAGGGNTDSLGVYGNGVGGNGGYMPAAVGIPTTVTDVNGNAVSVMGTSLKFGAIGFTNSLTNNTGGPLNTNGANGSGGAGGAGGGSFKSAGANGGAYHTTGPAATGYGAGGGGGGGAADNAAFLGGAGSPGIVIVYEYHI